MAKLLKKWMARELSDEIRGVGSFIFFGFDKVTAEQAHDFRCKLREKNIHVRVLKNTIAAIAFKEIYQADMREMFKGPTGMAYGGETVVDVAKTLLEWNKKKKLLTIKGGYLDGQIIAANQAEELSRLPSREVLLSLLAGVLQAPIQQVAAVLTAAMQDVSFALDALIKKREERGDG